ncbi:unnamed protein product [Brassica rapa subsp. narinosa]
MIPINSFLWILPLIAPMSVVLSEKTLRLMKPSSFAASMAARTAKASATRGDEMNSCVEEPIIVLETWDLKSSMLALPCFSSRSRLRLSCMKSSYS